MALYFRTNSGKDGVKNHPIIHIGSPRPLDDIQVQNVIDVQADGHELEQIHRWGFPNCGARVQHFYGDMARYIVGNWR